VSPVTRSELFRSSYRDSVELMRIAEEVKRLDGGRPVSEFGDWRAYWASREGG